MNTVVFLVYFRSIKTQRVVGFGQNIVRAMMQALLIANSVFNAFFSFTAITLNFVTILALRKPLTIPRAVKILLLSLAVSDLGVGLLAQPLCITRFVMMIKENTQTGTYEITRSIFYSTGIFLASASFFGVVALAADRFLAVHLHLRNTRYT